jgi:predicted RNA binding protein YcfA (HicA-like mRNA interferase family)
MARRDKLLEKILSGTADRNIPFMGMRHLLLRLGFQERVQGSHHIFKRAGVRDIINLQRDGHLVKGYQVRQVRRSLREHGLWSVE